MTAVIGGKPDEVLAAIEAHGSDGGQQQRNRADRRRRDHGAARCLRRRTRRARPTDPAQRRRRVPHGPHGLSGDRARRARPRHLHPRSADPAALQRRRSGRPRRPRGAAPARRPGRVAGSLGPLPGGDGRSRGHRVAGAAAGRHLDRDRQAQSQGCRAVRPEHSRPTARGAWSSSAGTAEAPRRRSPATRPRHSWWHPRGRSDDGDESADRNRRPFSAVLGIGGYRPRRVVDNAEICTLIDSTDEWIQTRSGIRERRWAAPDETMQMMSVAAARKASIAPGSGSGQIDTVIVSTVTHLYQTPAAATTIASELGAKGAAAFDISAACAGFCYGHDDGGLARPRRQLHVRPGDRGGAAVSDITSHTDRSTAFFFADGAGRRRRRTERLPAHRTGGLGFRRRSVRTDRADRAVGPGHRRRTGRWPELPGTADGRQPRLQVGRVHHGQGGGRGDGPGRRRADEIDVFVPHQANMRITDAMLRALKLPPSVVVGPRHRVAGQHVGGVHPVGDRGAAGVRRGAVAARPA